MALPIQTAPTFRCELSDGREVKFRPFLVKEQKYLLIARESENNEEIFDAIGHLLSNVTFGKLNIDDLPLHDVELLFLKVRSKSVGESSKIKLRCIDKNCNGTGDVSVDLDQVSVHMPEVDTRVMLNETTGLDLRYPNARMMAKVEGLPMSEQIPAIIKFCITTVFDEENVYEFNDFSDEEKTEFVDSFTINQLENITKFVDNLPTLQHEVSFTCNVCSKEQTSLLKGLQSFF